MRRKDSVRRRNRQRQGGDGMGSLLASVWKTPAVKSGLAGLAATLGMVVLRGFLRKPGVQAYLDHLVDRVIPFRGETTARVPDVVDRNAAAVTRLFQERGLVPLRLAVDGLPGSGKSALAAALGRELGMEVVCLDHHDMDQELDFSRPMAIYEHHRLFRTQSLDHFDALVYIDEPVQAARERVLRRKRGGYLVEILDYDLLKRVGDMAFRCVDGEETSIPCTDTGNDGNGSMEPMGQGRLRIKFRPETGFREGARIQDELRRHGFEDEGYTKEEALFLCAQGVRRSGFRAYLNVHLLDKELLTAVTGGLLGASQGGRGDKAVLDTLMANVLPALRGRRFQ
uniref:Uncharacterized protein n=1 Tax=delta proteobacterium ML-1 TaxID=947513 RepID=U5IGL2_9DELT|nr:hypothetical protein ALPM_00010 [delta proteobacterium ML-1]